MDRSSKPVDFCLFFRHMSQKFRFATHGQIKAIQNKYLEPSENYHSGLCEIKILLPRSRPADPAFVDGARARFLLCYYQSPCCRHQATPMSGQPMPRRNDTCPCGSGKRYKHCCAANQSAASGKRATARATPDYTELGYIRDGLDTPEKQALYCADQPPGIVATRGLVPPGILIIKKYLGATQ